MSTEIKIPKNLQRALAKSLVRSRRKKSKDDRKWYYLINHRTEIEFVKSTEDSVYTFDAMVCGPFDTFGETKKDVILMFKDILRDLRKTKRPKLEK
jgi:hypothetical protein